MGKKRHSDSFIINIRFAVTLIALIATWFLFSESKINSPKSPNTKTQPFATKSDKQYSKELNRETVKFANPKAGYSFEHPKYYRVIEDFGPYITDTGWMLKIDEEENETRGDVAVIMGDFIGRNGSEKKSEVFQRNITTKSGYAAIQYINIESANEPQGTGTVYTVITNGERYARIYTFIDIILRDVQNKENAETLSNESFNYILDNRIETYKQVVDSFIFL